jgi:hypothetical protein
MVDANSYDRDGGALSSGSQDHGVETPASVGTDERRMHVRAYNYWVSLLDGRAYPSIEDLNPETLDDFGPNSVLLDFTGGIEDPVISFLGHALQKECGLSDEVRSISEIPSRSLLSRLTDHYLQIIANRAPIGFEAEYLNDRGNNTMYRGILMPFSSDDDTIDFIYGVINWKEVAEAELEASLQDEVERALLATPRRQAVETPVWADGPSAEISDEAAPGFDDDDDDEIAPDFVPTGTEGLADWLVVAREAAEAAERADGRSRGALYGALARAYDFALVADTNSDEYHQLLIDSGIAVQERAPMTPVVKLVFGATYDKTRLAEYASALTYGRRQGIASGGFQSFLEGQQGGLKAVVRAERADRRPVTAVAQPNRHQERARKMQTGVILEAEGDEEFVILVARRVDEGHVAVLGRTSHDDALVQRALRQLQG